MGQIGYESLQKLVTLAAIISKLGHPRSQGVSIKFYNKFLKLGKNVSVILDLCAP